MTFDHDFGYHFPFFSSLLKKREEEKENELAKLLIKSHAFQLGLIRNSKGKLIAIVVWENKYKESNKEKKQITDTKNETGEINCDNCVGINKGKSINYYYCNIGKMNNWIDRSERHEFWSRVLLIHSPFVLLSLF